MKTTLLLFLFVLLQQTANAATWIVDNNTNSPQPIKTVQDAIDNYANAGDTIMVEGSPTSYGDFVITKSLTIIGEGSHDQSGENAIFHFVTIRASNVFITGFNFILGGATGIRLDAANADSQLLSNITIERCEIFGLDFVGAGASTTSVRNLIIQN